MNNTENKYVKIYYTPEFLQREINLMMKFLQKSETLASEHRRICHTILDSCTLIAESRDPQFFTVMQEEIISRLYKVYRICR